MSNDFYNRLTLGVSPTRHQELYSPRIFRQRLYQRACVPVIRKLILKRLVRSNNSKNYAHLTLFNRVPILQIPQTPNGQVAQLVERGPEKAGVGGSISSLATILFNN